MVYVGCNTANLSSYGSLMMQSHLKGADAVLGFQDECTITGQYTFINTLTSYLANRYSLSYSAKKAMYAVYDAYSDYCGYDSYSITGDGTTTLY